MHGVTGPNEYENNVNNNWYTSYIAKWCLKYTTECAQWLEQNHATAFQAICKKTQFKHTEETEAWIHVCQNIYLPYNEELGVFVQHDGFLEKELIPVNDLSPPNDPSIKNGAGIEFCVAFISNRPMSFKGFTFSKTISISKPMSEISNSTSSSPFTRVL